MTRTKSKLGTDRKLKSVSRRKPRKGYMSTSSTTLTLEDRKSLEQLQKEWDELSNWYVLSRFLLLIGIILLVVWIIWRLVG